MVLKHPPKGFCGGPIRAIAFVVSVVVLIGSMLFVFLPIQIRNHQLPGVCLALGLLSYAASVPVILLVACRPLVYRFTSAAIGRHRSGTSKAAVAHARGCCTIHLLLCRWVLFIPGACLLILLLLWSTAGIFRYPPKSYCFGPPPKEYKNAANHATFAWTGNLTDTSIAFRFAPAYRPCAVWRMADGAPTLCDQGIQGSESIMAPGLAVKEWYLDGLEPCTSYGYRFVTNANLPHVEGTFRTFPPTGATSCPSGKPITLLFGSCTSSGSDSEIFQQMQDEKADLLVHLGDLHYDDIFYNSVQSHAEGYLRVLNPREFCRADARPFQANMLRTTPIARIWDDHDFLGNDAFGIHDNKTLPTTRSAVGTFMAFTPHYPLPFVPNTPEGLANAAVLNVYQSFDIGSAARIILTDLSASRSDEQMMGWDQAQRLLADMVREPIPRLVVWGNSVPWLYREGPGSGSWGSHVDWSAFEAGMRGALERLRSLNKTFVMMSGDMHSQAFDDGRNTALNMPGFPMFQTAPFDKRGGGESCKGGPYMVSDFCEHHNALHGCSSPRYVRMRIFDDRFDVTFRRLPYEEGCDSVVTWAGVTTTFYESELQFVFNKSHWVDPLPKAKVEDPVRVKAMQANKKIWAKPNHAVKTVLPWVCLFMAIIFVGLVEGVIYTYTAVRLNRRMGSWEHENEFDTSMGIEQGEELKSEVGSE